MIVISPVKLGDIIQLESEFIDVRGVACPSHSFVVVYDQADTFRGIPYDLACTIISSFKSDTDKVKKMGYPYNIEVPAKDTVMTIPNAHNKDGFTKAEQLYLFSFAKTPFHVIGNIIEELVKYIIEFINSIPENDLVFIKDNL